MTFEPVFCTWKVIVPAFAVAVETPHSVSVALTAMGPPAVDDAVAEPPAPPDDEHAPSARRPTTPARATAGCVEVRVRDMQGLPEDRRGAVGTGQARERAAGAVVEAGVLGTRTGRRNRVRTMPT